VKLALVSPRAKTWAQLAAALALLLSLPLLLPPLYRITLLSALVLAIAALGLNVLYRTERVSLGHAAFFGVGAYTGGFLYWLMPGGDAFELYLASGTLAATLVSALFGLICVRVRRAYFGVLTLALTQMVNALFISGTIFRLFGGKARGLFFEYNGGLYIPRLKMLGQKLPDPVFDTIFGYVVVAAFVVSVAVLWRMDKSPFGWALRAIGYNEDRAAFIGIPVNHYRMVAFVISGGFTGLAGSLSGQLFQQVAPGQLDWIFSARLILMNVLGGTQPFWGAAAGAFLFVILEEIALRVTLYRDLVLGGLLVALVLFLPGGVMGRRNSNVARPWSKL
jgi:branched-chain amino acid transport system permease protein